MLIVLTKTRSGPANSRLRPRENCARTLDGETAKRRMIQIDKMPSMNELRVPKGF